MYNKENRNSKLINILLGVIAVFIIVFIVIWLVNRGSSNTNTVTNNQEFETNLNLMQDTAKEFFASQLPSEIGDNLQVTLQELYDIKAIDELKYGKDSCDPDESYIAVTKTAANEYQVKSNLVCGQKKDDIKEKIKSQTIVEDKDGNTIIDSDKDDVNLDINKTDDYSDLEPVDENTHSTDGKGPNTTINCTGPVCTFELIPTNCTMTYEYEFVKRTVTCPDGYTIGGATCVHTTEETAEPTPTYNEGGTKVVDAKVNEGEEHRVYVDPAIRNEDGEYYCSKGTLRGSYCYTYTDKETNYNGYCPDGYNKVGNYCYKYVDKNTYKTSKCPDGYTDNGTNCYKRQAATTTASSCPAGTTPSNGKCLKKVTAVKSYSAWGNPVKTYQSKTKEATYTYTLEKKVLLGSNKIGKTSVYTYAIYKRTERYTCAQGTLTNGACYVYTNPTSTTPKCPTGYTPDGAYCYKYANKETTSTSSCPSGYNDLGSTCYIRKNLSYSGVSTCPYGYTDNGYNCYKRTRANYYGGRTYYTCPAGYTQTGTGANTRCYRLEKTDDEYYCENAEATLKGKLCYIKVDPEFIGNKCPDGFNLGADNICHKTSTQTTTPIWSDVDYMYSYNDYVPGYQKTGRGKFIQHCTPISK